VNHIISLNPPLSLKNPDCKCIARKFASVQMCGKILRIKVQKAYLQCPPESVPDPLSDVLTIVKVGSTCMD
jgi:hypothetical protein